MKKIFALLTIGLLLCSGIRAPEASTLTNGFCSSGPMLEKVHHLDLGSHAFQRNSSNPLVIHSGFAPSFHPFDMPNTYEASQLDYLENINLRFVPSLNGTPAFPLFRPPITLSF